jgi:putative ABC transport system ATP-binding protein
MASMATISESASPEGIRTQSVCRHYALGGVTVRAVHDVSLQIAPGEFAALLGMSGSGKSTLLGLLAGMDQPTSGSIHVAGIDLANLSRDQLAHYRLRTAGMIFQAFNLIGTMTLLENVELPMRFAGIDRKEREQLAKAALDRVGLGDRTHHRPRELSGGQQQRGAIARAIINNPKVLFADEPTGNLDSRTGVEIMDLIRRLNENEGMTVLMVTHERQLASRYAKRLLFMADGRLVEGLE